MSADAGRWSLYRIFLAVCDAGSYSAAARALKLTHPTISRRIAELEALLEARLLAKSGDGYVTTEIGERFRCHIAAMAQVADHAEQALAVDRGDTRGTVRLSIGESLVSAWLTPHLRAFRAAHPRLQLEFGTRNWPASVRNRQADILVRLFGPGGENLVGRRIAQLGAAFYASKSYTLQHGTPLSRADWAAHHLVGFTTEGPEAELARWADRVTGGRTPSLRYSSGAGALAAIKQGLGIGPLACIIGDSDPDLSRIAPQRLKTSSEMWLLVHPDLRDAPAVRAVLDFITDRAAQDAHHLIG